MKTNPSQTLRLAVQAAFLLVAFLVWVGLWQGRCSSAHQFCPYATVCFGAIKLSFVSGLFFSYTGAVLAGLLIGISAIFLGRKFCSYVCPLGTLQEWLFKLRGKRYGLLKRVPFFYESRFAKLKYAVLLLTFFLVLLRKSPLYMNLCPILTLGSLPRLVLPGLVFLGLVLIGCLLVERFWCRFLCPYAALLNLFQLTGRLFGFQPLLIRRNLEKCTDCRLCNSSCPMNIDLTLYEYVEDCNCIHCLKCAAACPKSGTLSETNISRDRYE